MDIYRELILDHYKHPRNFGHLDHPDATEEEDNVTCGDRVVIEIKVGQKNNDKSVIEEIKFSGEGCAIDQASASILTEEVKGKSLDQVLALKTENILEMLGTELTPSRIKCAVLPLEVLQKAVSKIA